MGGCYPAMAGDDDVGGGGLGCCRRLRRGAGTGGIVVRRVLVESGKVRSAGLRVSPFYAYPGLYPPVKGVFDLFYFRNIVRPVNEPLGRMPAGEN